MQNANISALSVVLNTDVGKPKIFARNITVQYKI